MTVAASPIDRIQQRIADKIGPQRYRIWFRHSTDLNLTDGFLEIGVPNPFIGGWIENHFAGEIVEAAREVTGKSVRLNFVINADLSRQLRKTQLNSQADSVARQPSVPSRPRRPRGAPPRRRLRGRLDEFVVGDANQMAFAAAEAVVSQPGRRFNPLCLHGGCGLGKTHLLHGIVNGVGERHPDLSCEYLSAEEFTNEFVQAVRNARIGAFQRRCRDMDVLVVDDIHFLAGKKATQEQFLHTFNAIDAIGKQVVMASDAHPKMIGQLSESLVNRFVSGMVIRIEPPDLPTRCEILRRRAAALNRQFADNVIEYIADSIRTNVRELEGALLKLVAFSSLARQPVTLSLAEQALADHFTTATRIITASTIENTVAAFFGLTPADLHTSRKSRNIALARSVTMFLCRRHTRMSYPEIGRFLGNKNHSTVIQACRKIERLLGVGGEAIWDAPAGRQSLPIEQLLHRLEEQIGT